MQSRLIRKHVGFLFALLIVALPSLAFAADEQTALDRYIAKPDPSYSWKLAETVPGDGAKTFVINLTSQTWRSKEEIDRPVWTHWLTVVRPDNVKSGTAFLFIGGGSFENGQPKNASERVRGLARATNSVVAELSLVPNQPISFVDSEGHKRYEDDLVAYSRVKAIITGDDEWPVRLPMVKSGVRALDCIQEFCASEKGGKLRINDFVAAGGSKRGWTTWLVGTVDPRVKAIVPLVIDALNSEQITRHHYEVYGFFSPALKDYVRHGLFPYRVGTPEYRHILSIEDPYQYRHRERLKIPKFLINAAGDEFFLPDNSQFYFGELPDEKHLRYVPNAKHNLAGSDAMESLQAFYQSVLNGTPRPKYQWKKQTDGSLEVICKDQPRAVVVWQATNPDARDFRLDTIGKAWISTPLKDDDDDRYHASVPKPEKGFTAFFVEMTFDSGGPVPFKFTTEVSVVPDVLPHRWEEALKKPAVP